MSKIIRLVDGEFKVCEENQKENLIFVACYKLDILNDGWEEPCSIVYVNHIYNGNHVTSLVVVRNAEYNLTISARRKDIEFTFNNLVEHELAMNCSSESEAVEKATSYLKDKLYNLQEEIETLIKQMN